MEQQFSWPITEVSVAAPAGWLSKQSWTVFAPGGQANVIASSEPIAPQLDTEQYAQAQGDLLWREFPQFHEHSLEQISLGPRRALLRDFEWWPPDGVKVRQLQVYLAVSGQGFTATATTPASNFPHVEQVLRATLSRVRFGPWVGSAD
ncbi:DcrB-related protein [Terrabacter sp. MAHUQ-38]|jgi:hypothetical protein|uniref:DcrB-related protein n=1 Tax=unclassified Terrabacter TaxID=2630222 RepID=UPI00165D7DC9|nr:DcrB-related protein [Terrabacter sp. MAHUQ-38]MBC9820541.1 DcrB-related protein [Terrabacter sp. MAHUQ-38]